MTASIDKKTYVYNHCNEIEMLATYCINTNINVYKFSIRNWNLMYHECLNKQLKAFSKQ